MSKGDTIASERLRMLKLAEELGNVSEACRRMKISRTRFYIFRKRYEKYGIEGLKNLPPIHKSHPHTKSAKVVEKVFSLSLERPYLGCVDLSKELKEDGVMVSPPTIQKIRERKGIKTYHERWLKLEEMAFREEIHLTEEQIQFIEMMNPCFCEWKSNVKRPGRLLVQDSFFILHTGSNKRLYIQCALDVFSNYAFGLFTKKSDSELAVRLLRDYVIPFFHEKGLNVSAITTVARKEYYGKEGEPYGQYLQDNQIIFKSRTSQTRHGSSERFINTVKVEFIAETLRRKTNISLEEFQNDLEAWLTNYNNSRKIQGFPNMGKTPIDLINAYNSS